MAVGRAKTSEGLRVINYNPSLCKAIPNYVRDSYENYNHTQVYNGDLNCCRNHECFQDIPTVTAEIDTDSEIGDLIENVEEIQHQYPDHTYSSASATEVDKSCTENHLEIVFSDFKDTPSESKAHKALEAILNKSNDLTS